MRTFFWILLLGNVILFAMMQRGGLGWGEQPYQPQPALHQEKIRLLDIPQSVPAKAMPEPAPASAAAAAPAQLAASAPAANRAPAINHAAAASSVAAVSAASAASAPAAASPVPNSNAVPKPGAAPKASAAPRVNAAPGINAAPAASAVPAASQAPAARVVPVAVTPNAPICLEWGDFSGTDLKRATESLSAMQLGGKLGQREIQYDKGYWVYIPPLKNKAAANKKAAQIKALGVKEYFIVQAAGAFRYAISLGVFKTQEAAQNHLKELHARGLRTAQVGERASKLKTTMFTLNNVDASIEGKLTATKKDFPGSDLKKIPCALTK